MSKKRPDYKTICERIKKCRTRAKRAINLLDKLEKQKARIEREWASVPATQAAAEYFEAVEKVADPKSVAILPLV